LFNIQKYNGHYTVFQDSVAHATGRPQVI